MKKREKDDHFAAHLPGVLQFHQTMLADGVRNRLLYEAIKQSVNEDTRFLDVGAGTGVWAVLAALLGAKRVVAIEIEECLIPIIYKTAQENGVADRIEIIHANSDDVRIRGKFDVIVSELFGTDALGAGTVRSFVHIRDRFLAPDGVLIPQKLAVMVSPGHYTGSINDLPADLPLKTDNFRSIKLNYGIGLGLAERDDFRQLAPPQKLVEIDFRNVTEAPPLTNLSVSWQLDDLSQANAIATFNHSTFTDEIEMDAYGSQSWGTNLYEFMPFPAGPGELRYTTTLEAKTGNWSISSPTNPAAKPQNYAPVFAFTRIRMAQQMTPHRRIRPRKKKEAEPEKS